MQEAKSPIAAVQHHSHGREIKKQIHQQNGQVHVHVRDYVNSEMTRKCNLLDKVLCPEKSWLPQVEIEPVAFTVMYA